MGSFGVLCLRGMGARPLGVQGQGLFQAPWGLTQALALPQVHKLLIVVELLLGEIPDRLQFRQPSLKRSLMPYFLLTQGTAPSPVSVLPAVPENRGIPWVGRDPVGVLSSPLDGTCMQMPLGKEEEVSQPWLAFPSFSPPPFPPSLQLSGRGTLPSSTKSLTSLGTSSRPMAPTP